ncbi:MAG TPA: TonB-dependent receptor [Bryobacteraceae bacterium]|nr:TonB-dependent receptor [Bryobacteraceae bacterium]
MLQHTVVLGLVCALWAFTWQERPPAAQAKAPAPAELNGAASLRNENVQANRIDNDALKLANVRLGSSVTLVPQAPVEASYFATEHGRPPGELPVLRPAPPPSGWHGELFESLKNSVFNARTFFQVGGVKPSRQNQYGGRFSGQLKPLGVLTGSFQQRKTRGMVNGNVLVPLAGERTPLATDPSVRTLVERFLDAYPDQLPNRPDFDPRALNTNAPQRIDELDGSLRLDRAAGSRGRLFLSHALGRQRISAFQLVAGQNPDTEVHTQRSRLTFRYDFSERTDVSFGAGFTRAMSDLRPEPNAVGPRVRTGYQVEELGPDSQFPIHRALNHFRWGAVAGHRTAGGSHSVTFGGDLVRTRLNGIETANARGVVWFGNNFGRSAIENLRMGTPTLYEATVGPMARGYRNWGGALFAADQWKVGPTLQVYYGVRWAFDTTPYEVNGLETIPYGCDCNNVSPRFSIAWRGPRDWVVRTGYTVSFGQVLPVTYGQARYNLPHARYLQVQNPDLLDPFRGIDLNDPNGRTSPTFLSPELVAPYVHQYNFSLERRLKGAYLLRLGYVGSRTFHMLDVFTVNRAVPVDGIPLTTATVDRRRADPRYYDVKQVVNGGAAYLDAAQATIDAPLRHGLAWGAAYTFGKAIDTGTDYSGTAANNDLSKGRSQSQFGAFEDKKGLSNFDATHSLMFYWSYDLPRWKGWQISGSTLLKSGTPLTLYVGSDAPGFGNVDGGPSDRPGIVDPSILGMTIGNPDTAGQILRRDRFSYITLGDARGSLGRGTFRKGGIANVNAAVSRSWKWGGNGERTIMLRGEAFNLGNHPQFDEPQRNLSSPAFGKITNTLNDGRVLQLGLRLML